MLKKEVLRGKRDFSAVYNKGRSAGGFYTVLFIKPNGLEYNRLAFLASKKVGNSVLRNRARRLMKESFRDISERKRIKEGYDMIFIARNSINGKKCADVASSMEYTMRKLKIFQIGNGKNI